MGLVPPRIEPPKTIIGVGTRELVILGTGLMFSVLVILSGLAIVLKVGLAALFVGLAALLALGRAPATGKTFEEYFLDIYHFHKRHRFMQRGVGDVDEEPFRHQPPPFEDVLTSNTPTGLIRIRPLPLSLNSVFAVLSLCFLAMLILWLFLGGLQEFLLRFGIQ
jgi:hypothetical protein